MRVLYCIQTYAPWPGGAPTHSHEIAKRLPAGRVSVATIVERSGADRRNPFPEEPYELDGVPVKPVVLGNGERRSIRRARRLMKLFRGWGVSRIERSLGAALADRAQRSDVVHHFRVSTHLCPGARGLARAWDVPLVFTPHYHPGSDDDLMTYCRGMLRSADAIIALTESEGRFYEAQGVPAERIHVTGIGPVLADSSDGEGFRRRYGIEGPMVLYLGRKDRYKGVDRIVSAASRVWEEVPEARFVFAGRKTGFSDSLFGPRPDPRILELAEVELQEKTDAFAACDVFCSPSSSESFGGTTVEGMELAKPVIVGDIPASRDVVDEGENGFLIPVDAAGPKVLADRLIQLLQDGGLRSRMGEAGREKVRRQFAWSVLVEKTEAVYRGVIR